MNALSLAMGTKTRKSQAERNSVVGDFVLFLESIKPFLTLSFIQNKELVQFVGDLARVLARSKNRTPHEVLSLIDRALAASNQEPKNSDDLDVDRLRKLGLVEVRQLMDNPNVSRSHLLAIAQHRFGASTGTLNRLSRADLVDHLASLLRDEQSHDTIARLASTDPTKAD